MLCRRELHWMWLLQAPVMFCEWEATNLHYKEQKVEIVITRDDPLASTTIGTAMKGVTQQPIH